MMIGMVGCNEQSNSIPNRLKNYETSEGMPESGFDEASNAVTLSHDFGVLVQPISDTVTHEFEISNNTNFDWTLKQIVNTCSCTVADMTSNKIKPGTTEKVLLVYKPIGNGTFDDYRKSLVVFEEAKAPKIILTVESRVRESMTIRPKSLSWTQVGENQTKKDSFEVQNYSPHPWKTLEVSAKPQWLDVELKSVPPSESEPMMRQWWLADVAVDTTKLTPGEHRGEIILLATEDNGQSITQICPLILQITSAVSAVPAQFFFGDVKPNETTMKSIKVMFNPDSIPKDENEIQFKHNFGDSLKFEWLSTEGNTWELQASLNVTDMVLPDEPVAIISFPDPALPKIHLPIYVMMSTEENQ